MKGKADGDEFRVEAERMDGIVFQKLEQILR
jgi:hypothetical protein